MGVVPATVALVAATIAATTDIWSFRVYNVLTIPLLISGIMYHATVGSNGELKLSLAGAVFGFAVLVVPYAMGLMGAGDVKLMSGLGAWLGLSNTIVVFAVSALAFGIYATALMIYRGNLDESWATIKVAFFRIRIIGFHFAQDDLLESLMAKPDRRLRVVPFAASLPIGLIGAYIWLTWFQ